MALNPPIDNEDAIEEIKNAIQSAKENNSAGANTLENLVLPVVTAAKNLQNLTDAINNANELNWKEEIIAKITPTIQDPNAITPAEVLSLQNNINEIRNKMLRFKEELENIEKLYE